MNTLTKNQLNNYELNHAHSGNGYFMLEDLGKDYCRVVEARASSEFGTRGFLVAKDRLTVFKKPSKADPKVMLDVPIHDDLAEPLKQLRADIKSGKLAVFSSHIMPAAEAEKLRKEFESK